MADDITHTGAQQALPTTLADLVATRTRHRGHRPLLTWYDDLTGARTELSYATADNWAAKIANMLAEEFDAGPGSTIALDLDGHWTTAALVLACWKLGATLIADADAGAGGGVAAASTAGATGDASAVVNAGAASDADIVCCHETRLGDHPSGPVVVVGDGFTGEPTGTVDERDGLVLLGDVHGFADDYDDPDVTGDTGALRQGDATRSHADVLNHARAWWDLLGDEPRVGLATALDDPRAFQLLGGVIAASGALVAVRAHDDPPYHAHWTSERVTAAVAPQGANADVPADATLVTFDAIAIP